MATPSTPLTTITSHAQYLSAGIPSASVLSPSPTVQFNEWFQAALSNPKVHEPEAMALSTVSDMGVPSTRIVLCKSVDEKGWVFYTNYDSRKGKELFPPATSTSATARGAYASIAFYWPSTHQSIRVVGRAEKVSPAETKKYFDSRPVGSRVGAWASPQSQVLQSREELDDIVKSVENRFGVEASSQASSVDVGPASEEGGGGGTAEIPVPPHWGGVRIVPFEVEFWMGRESRLHDRFRYTRPEDSDGQWDVVRLAP